MRTLPSASTRLCTQLAHVGAEFLDGLTDALLQRARCSVNRTDNPAVLPRYTHIPHP
ncbi:hypothetical protein OH768_33435 [Streptomyces sp. NBC_01622]|uniref:hypothetical protein n=1 Tax=Streptomyces sp. NBC_01622 TaxID=2975903 RepID=UPI0038640F86|nr:hypothetical protein OH768_33435 [Streptomyces sp. NBC_01622]